jgi:hypothetical protein
VIYCTDFATPSTEALFCSLIYDGVMFRKKTLIFLSLRLAVLRRMLVVIREGVRLHLLCVATKPPIPYVDHSSGVNTDMRRLTTGIRPEKCVVRQVHRCANVIECTSTNIDSIAYYTTRLYVIAYCS